MTSVSEVFGAVVAYPDRTVEAEFDQLVGIDEQKSIAVAELAVRLDASALEEWRKRHGLLEFDAKTLVMDRSPLLVFAGDVGTGKTALAESMGAALARTMKLDSVTLFPLSLKARGSGVVGEMTTLISSAFDLVRSELPSPSDGRPSRDAGILLIDEADALAQSREAAQMHHEDRAGVNALIRGIDELRRSRTPVVVVMCTNRLDSLDPAIMRRAARVLEFQRPGFEQIQGVLMSSLSGSDVDSTTLAEAAELLGPLPSREYGVTYSDLRLRFIPDLVLSAFSTDSVVNDELVIREAANFVPTRPFGR